MIRYVYALLCLLLTAVQVHAQWGDLSSTDFQSTSSYYHSARSSASYLSSDGYRTPMTGSGSSFSMISADNFASLNGEDGEFYESSSSTGPHRGRPSGGGGAIGEYEQHSPVGDIPWLLMALLLTATVISRRRSAICKIRRFETQKFAK